MFFVPKEKFLTHQSLHPPIFDCVRFGSKSRCNAELASGISVEVRTRKTEHPACTVCHLPETSPLRLCEDELLRETGFSNPVVPG